jgi:hypothetical protein
MRASIPAAALLLGLALAGPASAQTLTNLSANNSAPTGSPGIGLTSFLRSTGLINLFSTSGYPQTAKPQVLGSGVTPSSIPDPNSAAYFQAFGYQRLTPPLSTTDRLLLFLVSRRQ